MESVTTPLITDAVVYQLAIATAKILRTKQTELSSIKWTNGESNLDSEYSALACRCCIFAWTIMTISKPEFRTVKIECSVPDINIKFTTLDCVVEKKIELKSSTKTSLIGSTVKSLCDNQPLIYCLRPKSKHDVYRIRCSQYHQAMKKTDHDLFQDRTPRPILDFHSMEELGHEKPFACKARDEWISHYASCSLSRLTKKVTHSWQDDLVESIKRKILTEFIENTSIEEFIKMKNEKLTN